MAWSFYITDLFMVCANLKHGCFNFLPCSGSLLDQPEHTMQVLQFIQTRYLEHLDSLMPKR
jgi:hypothetical protein